MLLPLGAARRPRFVCIGRLSRCPLPFEIDRDRRNGSSHRRTGREHLEPRHERRSCVVIVQGGRNDQQAIALDSQLDRAVMHTTPLGCDRNPLPQTVNHLVRRRDHGPLSRDARARLRTPHVDHFTSAEVAGS
jgi:hypothetical protein